MILSFNLLIRSLISATLLLIFTAITYAQPNPSDLPVLKSSAQFLNLVLTTSDFSSKEMNGWACTVGSVITYYNYKIGGYQATTTVGSYTKLFDSLPTHYSASIMMKFYLYGSWSVNDYIQLTISKDASTSIQYDVVRFKSALTFPTTDSSAQQIVYIQVLINHQISTMSFAINSNKASNYFGFRDIHVLFRQTTYQSEGYCVIAQINSYITNPSCICGLQYGWINSVCTPCDGSCAVCYSLSSSDCRFCNDGYIFNGNSCIKCDISCVTCYGFTSAQCLSCANGYYYNGNICASCAQNCAKCTGPGVQDCTSCMSHYTFSSPTSKQCFQCDSSCATCNGTLSTQCTSCSSLYSGNLYLYWDNTCHADCISPLRQLNTNGVDECLPPCNSTNDYFYPHDTSCAAVCHYPYNSSISAAHGVAYNVCNPLCTNSLYLFNNGTCASPCTGPLVGLQLDGVNICKDPCQNLNLFYYPARPSTSNCQADCDHSYNISKVTYTGGTYNTCIPICNASSYLYQNYRCRTTCKPPRKQDKFDQNNLCKEPCLSSEYFYFPQTNSCALTCGSSSFSYSSDNITYCILKKDNNTMLTQFFKTVGGVAWNVASGGLVAAFILSPEDPSIAIFAAVSKMLSYARYLNITYSPALLEVFKASTSGELPFASLKMPKKVKEKFSNRVTPGLFAYYDVKSSFLINFWGTFVYLLVLFGVTITFYVLEKIAYKVNKKWLPPTMCRLLRTLAQGFFLINFYSNFDDVTIFALIQFTRLELMSAYSRLSFGISVLLLLCGIAILTYHIYFLHKRKTIRDKAQRTQDPIELTDFDQRNISLQVFFKNFKDATLSQEAFLFFYVLRSILFSIGLTLLYQHPLFQVSLFVLLNITMLIYLSVYRPFRLFIGLLQQFTVEILLLITNGAILIQATLDAQDPSHRYPREDLSQVVLVIILMFKFVPNGFLAARLLIFIINYVQALKTQQKAELEQRTRNVNRIADSSGVSVSQGIIQNNQLPGIELDQSSSFQNASHDMILLNKSDKNSLSQQAIRATHKPNVKHEVILRNRQGDRVLAQKIIAHSLRKAGHADKLARPEIDIYQNETDQEKRRLPNIDTLHTVIQNIRPQNANLNVHNTILPPLAKPHHLASFLESPDIHKPEVKPKDVFLEKLTNTQLSQQEEARVNRPNDDTKKKRLGETDIRSVQRMRKIQEGQEGKVGQVDDMRSVLGFSSFQKR